MIVSLEINVQLSLVKKNNPISNLTLYKKAENTETEFMNVEL